MRIDLFGIPSKTLPIAATDVASSSTSLPNKGNTLRVVNEGPNVAFIAIGSGTQVATLPNATPTFTSIPVIVGETTFGIDPSIVLNISSICRSSQTAQLDFQVGEGA